MKNKQKSIGELVNEIETREERFCEKEYWEFIERQYDTKTSFPEAELTKEEKEDLHFSFLPSSLLIERGFE